MLLIANKEKTNFCLRKKFDATDKIFDRLDYTIFAAKGQSFLSEMYLKEKRPSPDKSGEGLLLVFKPYERADIIALYVFLSSSR